MAAGGVPPCHSTWTPILGCGETWRLASKCSFELRTQSLSPSSNQIATFKLLLSEANNASGISFCKTHADLCIRLYINGLRLACCSVIWFFFPFSLHKMSETSFQVNTYRAALSFLMIACYFAVCVSCDFLNCSHWLTGCH